MVGEAESHLGAKNTFGSGTGAVATYIAFSQDFTDQTEILKLFLIPLYVFAVHWIGDRSLGNALVLLNCHLKSGEIAPAGSPFFGQ